MYEKKIDKINQKWNYVNTYRLFIRISNGMARKFPVLIDIGQGLSLMTGFPTIATWDTSKRPKKAKTGTFGVNTETNTLEYFDGEGWYSAVLDKA